MIRIKICGITNVEDALLATEMGADALGFVFSKSSRRIDADQAQEIISQLPPFISLTGVFVNESVEIVKHVARKCGLNILQFHGDEDLEYLEHFHRKIVKGFSIKTEKDLEPIPLYKEVHAFLLDTKVDGKSGGTGKTFDWNLAIKAKQYGRIILAGGLTSENVVDAIKQVQPYAVDVSSGIESAPGKKDPEKMKAFIQAIRQAGY